jgi:hypothetical protein
MLASERGDTLLTVILAELLQSLYLPLPRCRRDFVLEVRGVHIRRDQGGGRAGRVPFLADVRARAASRQGGLRQHDPGRGPSLQRCCAEAAMSESIVDLARRHNENSEVLWSGSD